MPHPCRPPPQCCTWSNWGDRNLGLLLHNTRVGAVLNCHGAPWTELRPSVVLAAWAGIHRSRGPRLQLSQGIGLYYETGSRSAQRKFRHLRCPF